MRTITTTRSGFALCLALALAIALPGIAAAKEESKIKVPLENLVGGTKHDEAGSVRTHMADGSEGQYARLSLKVKRLLANTEYLLMSDGTEIGRLTTGPDGGGRLSLDLLAADMDARGTYLTVNDGTQDVLGAWLYGARGDDAPRTRIKEVTMLLPDDAAAPDGRVHARYTLNKNGKETFRVALRGLDPGDYEVCVDGTPEASLTTNADGNAKVELRLAPSVARGKGSRGNGKGPAHNQRSMLSFEPRDATIEIKSADDGTLLFSGPMRAQVGFTAVPSCTAMTTVTAMTLDPAADASQAAAVGDVTTGNEDDCDEIFEVDLAMMAPGDYEVSVDGAVVDMVTIMDDGGGTGGATLLYDENPDSGELPLTFTFGAGSLVEVREAGAGGQLVLSATLP